VEKHLWAPLRSVTSQVTHHGCFPKVDVAEGDELFGNTSNLHVPPQTLDNLIDATNVDTNCLSDPASSTSKLAEFCTAKAVDRDFGTTTTAYSCHWKVGD
jgi:hypothetical protein